MTIWTASVRVFVICLVCLAAGTPAVGETYGDYDGDGIVDIDDFIALAGCMTGPTGGPVGPGCDVFDYDLGNGPDGFVDMADFAFFQVRGSPCTPCPPSSSGGLPACFAWAEQRNESEPLTATAASARIETRPTKLCGEDEFLLVRAQSNAFVGVAFYIGAPAQGGVSELMAATGYSRERIQGEVDVRTRVYGEIVYGLGEEDFDVRFHPDPTPPYAGSLRYHVAAENNVSGKWFFYYGAGGPWGDLAHPEWAGQTGNTVVWTAEIQNEEDQMVGRPSQPCHFHQCTYEKDWLGDTIFAQFDPARDFHSSGPEWVIRPWVEPGPERFRVWDLDP